MRRPALLGLLPMLVLAVSCRPALVSLPPSTQAFADGARQDAFPRPTGSALPVLADEYLFEGCGIERIQGATIGEISADGVMLADQPARASGWAFAPDEVPGIPDAWLRLLPLEPGLEAAQFPLVAHFPRPDVARARSAEQAAFSGFSNVTLQGLAPGRYHAQVVFASRDGRWACRNVREVVLK